MRSSLIVREGDSATLVRVDVPARVSAHSGTLAQRHLCDDGVKEVVLWQDSPQLGKTPFGDENDHDLERPRLLPQCLQDRGMCAVAACDRSVITEGENIESQRAGYGLP
jgi:hypothetical protein